jgi:hypothetical protein
MPTHPHISAHIERYFGAQNPGHMRLRAIVGLTALRARLEEVVGCARDAPELEGSNFAKFGVLVIR